MLKKILQDVDVIVIAQYQPKLSHAGQSAYVFSYTVRIINRSDHIIHLMRRKWNIIDSLGFEKIVEGEGVVGRQPIIEPGTEYVYSSATSIESELGKMYGEYYVRDMKSHEEFIVSIPVFELIVPYKLN